MPGKIMRFWLGVPVLALFLSVPASAEILRIESGGLAVQTQEHLPTRGQHQQSVLGRHGPPVERFATVGGDSPVQPPITRWDYDGFSVVFEGPLVLHSVVHGPHTPR